MQDVIVLALALICVLVTAAAQISLKLGVSGDLVGASDGFSSFLVRAFTQPMVWAGLFLYAVSALLWLVVLSRAEVSYAYPLVGLAFVFVALFAHLFLDETLSPARIAGIAFIVAGVFLVTKA